MKIFHLLILLFTLSCAHHQAGRAPASHYDAKSYGWYITFEDHFSPAQEAIAAGADSKCFYNHDTLCMENSWGIRRCPEWNKHLTNLNKCTWKVYDYYNYMDYESPEGEGVNAFDPSQVEVKGGYLFLNAKRSSFQAPYDCKNKVFSSIVNENVHTKKCPFISGGIQSSTFDLDGRSTGFHQEYGRFEVYAKLSSGNGTWPAHWLVPTHIPKEGVNAGCGWPYNGEIDIMEMVAPSEHKFGGSLHTGKCQQNVKFHENHEYEAEDKTELTGKFNTYAVEWHKDRITFIFNDQVIGESYQDKIVDGKIFEGPAKGDPVKGLPLDIPHGPFYWILNTTIEKRKGYPDDKRPNPENFPLQEHVIDYVKTYRPCTKDDPKEKCKKFATKRPDGYNSSKRETAFADMLGFPNPVRKNDEFTIELELRQDCQDVKLHMINILGQHLGVHAQDISANNYSSGKSNNMYLYDGPLLQGERRSFRIVAEWASGVYMAVANYDKCGPDGKGSGNHVWKMIID